MPNAFLAPALEELRSEFNKNWPKRDKGSDGWVGDPAHAARVSDHNPDKTGMVHAIDVDKDGVPMQDVVDFLVNQHKSGADNRLWYIIFNRVIYSRTYGWAGKPYTGANAHDKHAHFSLRYLNSVEANRAPWLKEFNKDNPDSRYTDWSKSAAGKRAVKLWDSGEDVKKLQFILNRWYGLHLSEDGYFGPGTNEAVIEFQKRAGLETDGIVGPKSWKTLNVI